MQTLRTPTLVDYGLILFTAFIWALAFIAIKVAVGELSPLWVAASRVTIGFLVLLPFAISKGLIWPDSPKVWKLVIAMSLLNISIPFFLISWAETRIDAGVTSLLMGVGPFLALLGSHFFTGDDRITLPKFIGVVLGFTGVIIIVGGSAFNQMGGGTILAQFAALAGSICYVTAGILIRKIDIPPLRLATLALLIGTITLLITAIGYDGIPAMPSQDVTNAILFLGIVPTGIAYILRFHLIRTVGYTTFALGINLIPVFGVFLGVFLLGEALTLRVVLALCLVLAGLFVSRLKMKEKPAL